jgi:putative peptidoglycan lipid II flippase
VRVSLALGILSALHLLAALIAQLTVLRIVGVGPVTDAYIAAQAVPVVLAAVVSASLQSVWLPRFARAAADRSVLRTEQAIAQGQALKLLLGLSLPLSATLPLWVRWIFPGFSADQLTLVAALSWPLLAAGVLTGQGGLLTAGLRSSGRFLAGEVVSLVGAIATIVLLIALVPRYGIVAAPWITLLRAAAVWGLQWLLSGRPGVTICGNAAGREVWRQLRPLVGGALFIKTSPLVDRYWSSLGSSGDVTVLNIAQLGTNSVAAILERSILVPVVPEFARYVQHRDAHSLRGAYQRCLSRTALAVATVGLLLVLLWPIWALTLQALVRVPPDIATQIWLACLLLLPALFVSVGGSAAVAVFYAFGETRTPVTIGVAGFMVSLVLKAVLFKYFGILGIAAGTSAYLVMNMVLYHRAVNQRIVRAG